MILVTGAAGFIGSHVARRFNENGYKTITIDNLSTGKKENIPSGTVFIEGDCGDPAVIRQLEAYAIEGIIHIAGQSSGEISFSDPTYDLNSNTHSTLLLLKFAHNHNIKRFVFASTMAVYGDTDDLPVSETMPPSPKSFYAVGKLASEHYMRIYAGLGLTTIALRLFNVYGPGQNLDNMQQGMASIFLAQMLRDGKVVVKGKLSRFRDFVFIEDVVDAFTKAYLIDNRTDFSVYNVCSGYPITVGDLLKTLQGAFGQDIPVDVQGNTPGDMFGIYGDNNRIGQDLQWQSSTTFQVGIAQMVEWAKTL